MGEKSYWELVDSLRVAVIGGGLQGACVAMELATRGVDVDLFDANPALMDGASRHTEGKIHLGFVYANDSSLKTAELMARGAGSFSRLMRRWLGAPSESIPLSSPFNYAVHKDSILQPDRLDEVYRDIAHRIRRLIPEGAYFGIEEPYRLLRVRDDRYGPAVQTVFSTREIAVSPDTMADLVEKAVVDADHINVVTLARVVSASAKDQRLTVSLADGSVTVRGPYDHIVNCAWHGRPAIDATVGLDAGRSWTFRMKYFYVASGPTGGIHPSTTVVLGPFGDIVDYGTGDHYLAWYPAGRLGWSTALVPPRWPTHPEPVRAVGIARETVRQLEHVLPGVAMFSSSADIAPDVRGGVIFNWGDTDVDDPNSEMHRRSEVGVYRAGRYLSIDTGKYTLAPLFAVEAADLMLSTR
jgi:glycine/D-amino acid oxidase-like deaminating enzyme